jgi:hypothetical protein
MKTLYYLHIPKNGGKAFQNLIPILQNHNLNVFTNMTTSFNGYDKFSYIQTHYGSHVIDNYPNADVACLVRDPLDRMVSQFAWAMMTNFYGRIYEEYNNKKTKDLLRYFLFKDENLKNNNNLQAKFLCNPIDSGIFYLRHIGPLTPEGGPVNLSILEEGHHDTTWLIRNDKTSVDYAKKQIDKMLFVDTIENHDKLITKVCNWFKINYNIEIEQEFRDSLINENPTFNYSTFTDFEGIEWNTSKLKKELTQQEIDIVYSNNSIDLEIYNYVKERSNK